MAHIFRSQLKELVATVVQSGLPAERFVFSRDFSKDNLDVPLPLRIAFTNCAFHFSIDYSYFHEFSMEFLPGKEQTGDSASNSSWAKVVDSFAQWIEQVKRQVAQPEPWLIYTQGTVLTGTLPTGTRAGEKISEEELRRLRAQTILIEEFVIREVKPSKQQLDGLNRKLDYLEESAQRLNKQDWANVAIATIVNSAIILAVDKTTARALFSFVSEFITFLSRPLVP